MKHALTGGRRSHFALAFIVSLAVPAIASSQQPTPAQVQQILSQPGASAMIRSRIQASGLTVDQIRRRLSAAGYPESLLDRYLQADSSRLAPSDTILDAITALGMVAEEEAAALRKPVLDTLPTEIDSLDVEGDSVRIFGLDVFRSATAMFQPDIAGPVDANYRVGPRDVLALIITGSVEASYSLEVTREGFVVIPQVGQVFVANLTLEQVSDVLYPRLRRVYSSIGRDASASSQFYVTVVRLRTNQVFVIGEVQAPSSYQVSSVGTVLTALYAAGGPSEIGSLRNVELRRGGRTVATVDLYDFLIRGDASSDARLETGDVVFVPPHGSRVELVGEVLRPAIYELKAGETLRDALRMAGGLTTSAGRRRLLIRRVVPPSERDSLGGRDRTVLDVAMDASPASTGPNIELVDGDRIEVFAINERIRNSITVSGAVWAPGDQGFTTGLSLSEALRQAGGTTPDATNVIVSRLQSDLSRFTLRAQFADTLGTLVSDLALQEDDSVRVFGSSEFRPERYVAINGAVRKDGRYPWREGMTLRDLIQYAGGLEDGAYLVHSEVARLPAVRGNGTIAITLTVPLDSTYLPERSIDGRYAGPPGAPVAASGTAEFELRPYDNVLILRQPEWLLERRVTVVGEVRFPGTYALTNKRERISRLIERAGGLLETAYPAASEFVRFSRATGRVGFDLERALRQPGSKDDFVLEPGDTLRIPRFIPTVQVSGAVNSPIAVAHVPGKRLSFYVEAAGGDTYLADMDRAYVRQPNGVVEPFRNRFFPLPDHDPTPQPGAQVFVPTKDPDDKRDWTALAASVAQILASTVAIIVVLNR